MSVFNRVEMLAWVEGRWQIAVRAGRVDLGGQVPGQLAHRRALEIVAAVPGVRERTDHLAVAVPRTGRPAPRLRRR
jgi:hypothetical protein